FWLGRREGGNSARLSQWPGKNQGVVPGEPSHRYGFLKNRGSRRWLWRAACRSYRSPGRDQPMPGPSSEGPQCIVACLGDETLTAASVTAAQRKAEELKMTCEASAECLDVRPHCALRAVGIMVADGGKNGFMLLLKAAVVVRRGK